MKPNFLKNLVLLLVMLFAGNTGAKAAENYRIESVKDNVYRFTAGNYHTVFMVTQSGIFVADPLNEDAAAYLKSQLEKRFKQPIKYMAYSHNHVDHSLGGEVFAEAGATVLAHRYAAEDMKMTRLPTAMPAVMFEDRLLIDLGDSQVELNYHGPNNGRGSVSMLFKPAKVLFVVDWIVVGRMPYRDLPGYDIHGMIHSTKDLLAHTSFDMFVGGHSEIGTRKDVERYLAYLEALYAAVRDGMLAGKTLNTLQAEIKLPEFADLRQYDEWLPLNVAGVYRVLMDMSYFNFRPDIKQ